MGPGVIRVRRCSLAGFAAARHPPERRLSERSDCPVPWVLRWRPVLSGRLRVGVAWRLREPRALGFEGSIGGYGCGLRCWSRRCSGDSSLPSAGADSGAGVPVHAIRAELWSFGARFVKIRRVGRPRAAGEVRLMTVCRKRSHPDLVAEGRAASVHSSLEVLMP